MAVSGGKISPEYWLRRREKKRKLLGMSEATARSRLHRMLLRVLIKEVFDGKCLRCNQTIHDDEEFHIDHIKSWAKAKNPRKTYFDVKNLAFSHAMCNKMAAEREYVCKETGEVSTLRQVRRKKFLKLAG